MTTRRPPTPRRADRPDSLPAYWEAAAATTDPRRPIRRSRTVQTSGLAAPGLLLLGASQGLDQVGHSLLVRHRPVKVLRLEETVESSCSTKFFEEIKRAGE